MQEEGIPSFIMALATAGIIIGIMVAFSVITWVLLLLLS